MATTITELPSRIPRWIKRVLPIVISILILYYYFHNQDRGEILMAMSQARLLPAVLAVALSQLFFWFFEVLVMERLISWFHKPLPFKRFFLVRGSVYLLTMVHPLLGNGGILVYLWRKTGISWRKLWGIVFFRLGLSIWGAIILLLISTLAMHSYGFSDRVKLNLWAWWGFLIFGLYWLIEAWLCWHHGKRFGITRLLVRNPENELWEVFRTASKRQWFLTWAITLPPLLGYLIGNFFLSRAFNVKVPFFEYMVAGPLMLVLSEIPIAFAGFGTTTLAFFTFFSEYGSPQTIAALTLFFPFARAVFRALLGLVCLRPALQDINPLMNRQNRQNPKNETAFSSDP